MKIHRRMEDPRPGVLDKPRKQKKKQAVKEKSKTRNWVIDKISKELSKTIKPLAVYVQGRAVVFSYKCQLEVMVVMSEVFKRDKKRAKKFLARMKPVTVAPSGKDLRWRVFLTTWDSTDIDSAFIESPMDLTLPFDKWCDIWVRAMEWYNSED
jgi:hypothetical protein